LQHSNIKRLGRTPWELLFAANEEEMGGAALDSLLVFGLTLIGGSENSWPLG